MPRRNSVGDDYRLLPRYRRKATTTHALDDGAASTPTSSSSYTWDAADAWLLRGIPCHSDDGVGGTMADTDPLDWILRHDPFDDPFKNF